MDGQPTSQVTPKFKGEILLCEDSEINQHVIKSHLTRLGFEVTVANNGKECLDTVSVRTNSNKRPFDLIFMDIYMPVMGGLEASDALIALGNKIPVVALTANTKPEDIETYIAHGMPNSLNKPVVPEEMWSCLYKYFTPLSFEALEVEDEDAKQRKRLLTSFVKRNQTTFSDISNAITSRDIKLAHRLAHTLRGLSGLMGKTALQEAAGAVEYALADNNLERIAEKLHTLNQELTPVLAELAPLLNEDKPPPEKTAFDKEKAAGLFKELAELLDADSAKCLQLTDSLRDIPGTGVLIEQMEDYEFEAALDALANLRKTLGL